MEAGGRAVIVGGGIVGISAAYALSLVGLDIVVVTGGAIGDGATSGNAGLLVPADSTVWPGPENARSAPATLLGRGAANIRVEWRNPHVLPWGARFLASSTSGRYARSCQAVHRLSEHSLTIATDWLRLLDPPAVTMTGMLFVYDSQEAREQGRRARSALREAGVHYDDVDGTGLADIDPAYGSLTATSCALYARDAAQGDSRRVSTVLGDALRRKGHTILEDTPVRRVEVRDGRVRGVVTSSGVVSAEVVVIAAGVGSDRLAATVGVRIPVLPVKGYSATVPVDDPRRAPRIGGVLEGSHVAYSRMGDVLRFSTGAEIGRRDHQVTEHVKGVLRAVGEASFPRAAHWSRATYRAEHRPMTPTGLPLIGPTHVGGLFLDTGHGSLGWTQAAGSGDLLARLITGEPPPLDPTPFRPARSWRAPPPPPIRSTHSGENR